MHRKKYLYSILLVCMIVLSTVSCKKEPSYNLHEQLGWIIGKWENTGHAGMFEEWVEVDKYHLRGINYRLDSSGKQRILELIELISQDRSIIYTPRVYGQNEDQAIPFRLSELSNGKMIFENKKHDFPQMIRYERLDDDHFMAVISGPSKTGIRRTQFDFKRASD